MTSQYRWELSRSKLGVWKLEEEQRWEVPIVLFQKRQNESAEMNNEHKQPVLKYSAKCSIWIDGVRIGGEQM